MHISKTDSHMDNHPVLLAIDKWWIILIRNGFNSTAKINLGDFSQSGCLFWFFIFIFSIQWRLIVTIGHSIKLLQSRFIPPIIKIDIFSNHSGKCFQSLGTELDGEIHTLSSQTPAGIFGCVVQECIVAFSLFHPAPTDWMLMVIAAASGEGWGTKRFSKGWALHRLPSELDLEQERPCMHACSVASLVSDSVTLWTVVRQAPFSRGFFRQEYQSGLPCPPPGDLPEPEVEPAYPALQADSLSTQPPGKPKKELGSLCELAVIETEPCFINISFPRMKLLYGMCKQNWLVQGHQACWSSGDCVSGRKLWV